MADTRELLAALVSASDKCDELRDARAWDSLAEAEEDEQQAWRNARAYLAAPVPAPPAERTPDPDCVCSGNWRTLVKQYEPLIGKHFRDRHTGEVYTFYGLVHSDDDFYYGLSGGKEGKGRLDSCVGSLEHFYDQMDDAAPAAEPVAQPVDGDATKACISALRLVSELEAGRLPNDVFRAVDSALEMVDAPKVTHAPTRQYWCWKHGAYGEGSCPLCAAEPVAQQPPPACKTDPRAPHGFLRNESHSEGRYVCECEDWEPPAAQQPEAPHEQHHLSTSDAITQHAPTPEAPPCALCDGSRVVPSQSPDHSFDPCPQCNVRFTDYRARIESDDQIIKSLRAEVARLRGRNAQ